MKRLFLTMILAAVSGTAAAEVVIGVSLSRTGSGASLGVPVGNAIDLMPKEIAGEAVRYVILDDASDPTTGGRHIGRLATEDKVDAIIGSSSVPVAIAQGGVAGEAGIPYLALCPIPIAPAQQPYVFAIPHPIPLMVNAVVTHMRANKVRSVGYIGFSDAWGDINYGALKSSGLDITANERYARLDTSVNAQVLKVVASRPDAIFVGASGTPAALPQIAAVERGYRKPIYHTHGVINRDFLRVAGKSVEGVIAPTGPVVVAEQLDDSNPLKAPGLAFLEKYEGAYGAGSRNAFAAYAWDAGLLLQAAIPVALKTAKPGTPHFRKALRDALESNKDVRGTHAIYNMSPTDHYGLDERSRVLVTVKDGAWTLLR